MCISDETCLKFEKFRREKYLIEIFLPTAISSYTNDFLYLHTRSYQKNLYEPEISVNFSAEISFRHFSLLNGKAIYFLKNL